MGRYIQAPEPKVQGILDMVPEAKVISEQEATAIGGESKQYGIVCVVDNGPFTAAGFADSDNELLAFLPTARDRRPRTWLRLPREEAERLTS